MPEAFVVTPATRPAPLNVVASKSRFSRQVPKLVVTKSSDRQAQKAADLHRTAIRGISHSTW